MKPLPQPVVEAAPDRRLSAQFEATRALATAATLEEAMPAILHAVCANLGWEVGAFWTFARGGDALECRATWRPAELGAELEQASREVRFKKGEGLPGRVWESGQWLQVDVAKTDSPRVAMALRAGFKRAFAYPITGPGGFFGVVEFSSREMREPDDPLLEMLGSIASQIGQFLDRRRAEDSTRFLSEASAVLATSLDVELTFARLVALSVPFLGDWCAVDVVQDDRPFRRIAAAHVDPAKARLIQETQERWPPPADAPAGYPKVLRTGEGDFFPDVPQDQLRAAAVDDAHRENLLALGYRSMICVPLTVRGRPLGAMTFVISGGDRRFERRDYELAQDLARRAGVAIDNARLFGEVERGRRSAALLAEASRVLASTGDVRGAMQEVARLVGAELGEIVQFVVLDDAGSYDMVGWVEPQTNMLLSRMRPVLSRLPAGIPIGVPHALGIDTAEMFDEKDLAEALRKHPLSDDDRERMETIRAGITAPMTSRGQKLGAFVVRSLRPGRRYSKEQVDLVQDLAQRAAVAVENARLHRQASEAVSARDEFLSVASHELRTPLTALHLLVRTLQDGPPPAVLTPEKLEIAERQIQRIAKLVNQLFDLSRVTAGQLELELEEVDLAVVGREVAARMATDAFDAGCVVAVRTPSPAVGRWDRFRLEQIATNLLSNALKFGRGKPVEIAVEDRGDEARLTVRDAGIGILPEHANRIFERFSRGSRRYDGLGLGLYIIKQILDALGGRISVESEPGKGALFIVDLPKNPPPKT